MERTCEQGACADFPFEPGSPGSSSASSRDAWGRIAGATGGGKIIPAPGMAAFTPSPSLALRALPRTCSGGFVSLGGFG